MVMVTALYSYGTVSLYWSNPKALLQVCFLLDELRMLINSCPVRNESFGVPKAVTLNPVPPVIQRELSPVMNIGCQSVESYCPGVPPSFWETCNSVHLCCMVLLLSVLDFKAFSTRRGGGGSKLSKSQYFYCLCQI